MINCYIIGEISSVEPLCGLINNYPITELKGYSMQKPESFDPVYSLRPEIVFIDDKFLINNETWLERIRQFAAIIIVSNQIDRAFEAFEYQAFDYLLKPISFNRFVKCINKFDHITQLAHHPKLPRLQPISDCFFIKADSKGIKQVLIKCNDLIYIEALQNYVILHLERDKKFCCYNTMKEMEDSLPEHEFSRVHKSFIINDSKIISIDGNAISLKGTENLKIIFGTIYKKAFMEKKSDIIIKRHRKGGEILTYPKLATSFILCLGASLQLIHLLNPFLPL
ncbi:hypothetical protein DHW03_03220 [Pedobacter yonginense]|uniref:HTH LytTR-type domain-containing protein n=1 Tax=Pedobacter yonginense TaxID=651869 RepID=A0A317EUL7_9SPHI|nr:LytTR family DNA-binding domain-containing protein [Pedobacter yonginense]PWS28858.1 hypothetical protein DHW03_03220 [Pedobacter yonginense]